LLSDSGRWCDRRSPFRRCRLQCDRHAADRGLEGLDAAGPGASRWECGRLRWFTALSLALLSIPTAVMAGWQDYVSGRRQRTPGPTAANPRCRPGRCRTWPGPWRRARAGAGDGPQGHTINANDLAGHWRCRQIKLGRMESYLVYERWFDCNIRALAGGLTLEKSGGSQRLAGLLFPDNGAWVYVGASRVRGEPRHDYSGASPALGAAVTPDDQVGLFDRHRRQSSAAGDSGCAGVVAGCSRVRAINSLLCFDNAFAL